MQPLSIRTTLGLTATLLGAMSQSASAAAMDIAPGTLISTLGFTDTGTTIGMVNDINSLPANVSTYTTVPGPDGFYTFTVYVGGEMTFKLTPTNSATYDPALYLLGGTPVSGSAIIGRDAGAGGAPEQFTVALNPGTYFLVVDSFYTSGPASAGTYLLEVTGAAQIPEPGSAALTAGVLGAAVWRRRRRGAR